MINTILLTDDNIHDNAIIKNYLYREQLNIISALNGREALDFIESRNVDIIILDLLMPVLDGYGFLEEFSKTPFYKEIPIIISSSLDDTDLNRVLCYDIFDFIFKPLDNLNKALVVNKIKKALQFRSMLLELKQMQPK